MKKCEQTVLFIATHYIIGGHRSVRIAAPSLPPHHSRPVTTDFQSFISVEALLCGCHLDVQGLLHQQLLSSAVVQHCGLLPVDRVVVSHACSTTANFSVNPPLADISVFLQSRLQSLSGLTWPQLQGIRYTTLDCLPRGNASLIFVNIEWDSTRT